MKRERGDKRVGINILRAGQSALTLEGVLEDYSTRRMHTHSHHQVLRIQNGVSLLVDRARKQPLFGSMTALIPADLPHRSTVVGDSVTYKSLYFAPDLLQADISGIVIFNMSDLGSALFDRIAIHRASDLDLGLNRECLDLLLNVLREDMLRPVRLVRVPEPGNPHNRGIVDFIERNYARKLAMSDFATAFPYSERHLARLFRADLNMSIFDYLRLFRMLTASVALSVSHRNITEIAYDSGYESLSTFYRDFTLIFGLTPRAFRERMGKGENR